MSKKINVIEEGSSKPGHHAKSRFLPSDTYVTVFAMGNITEVAVSSLSKGAKFHLEGRGWKVIG